MGRLTSFDKNMGLLVNEEERLLSSKGFIDKDEMYKIMRHLAENLYEYENLEEQGLLRRLPCSIGSDVYFIPSKVNFELNKLNGHEESNRVYHQKVSKIVFNERGWYMECDKNLEYGSGWYMECDKDLEYGTGNVLLDKFYKETWFLTQNEAEEALRRMEREE